MVLHAFTRVRNRRGRTHTTHDMVDHGMNSVRALVMAYIPAKQQRWVHSMRNDGTHHGYFIGPYAACRMRLACPDCSRVLRA